MTNHQRIGAISNAHAGKEFETYAFEYFAAHHGLSLEKDFSVELGIANFTKAHKFDLASNAPPILVECKSHNWTETGNMPSAKVAVWNEAMYLFSLAPPTFQKILFVLEAQHAKQKDTLAEYYMKVNRHLIPVDVETLEFSVTTKQARFIKSRA